MYLAIGYSDSYIILDEYGCRNLSLVLKCRQENSESCIIDADIIVEEGSAVIIETGASLLLAEDVTVDLSKACYVIVKISKRHVNMPVFKHSQESASIILGSQTPFWIDAPHISASFVEVIQGEYSGSFAIQKPDNYLRNDCYNVDIEESIANNATFFGIQIERTLLDVCKTPKIRAGLISGLIIMCIFVVMIVVVTVWVLLDKRRKDELSSYELEDR